MMQPDQNPQPLLSVRDLKVRFGSKQVVHGVSFDVRAGKSWRWWANPARARP